MRELAARNPRVTIEKLDLLDPSAIKALAVKYRGRPIDVLLNNGGLLGDMKAQQLGSLDYQQFEDVMAVNVYAPLAMAEAFQDSVAASQQKKIVSITSRSGVISLPGWRGPYFYRASKIGLNMITRVLADDLRELAARHPRVTLEKLDLLDRAGIKALGAKYRGRPIDVLLNNGGLLGDMKAQQLGSLDYKQFEEVMAVNVYAPLAMAEAFVDSVAASTQKKIVSMTSRSGVISLPGYRGPYFYRASKIGLNMVTRILADDLRERGIIVATISPPPTETDMLRALIGPEGASRQAKPAVVIAGLIKVIDGLTQANTAEPTYVDGTKLPW